jgi:flagellar hook-length control protein FliK
MLSAQSGQGADAQAQATGATSETARATPTPAVLQAAPAATVQVYNRIIERADGRAQRFDIRLDPAELGRVDVRIEIGADRKVHAVLAAHDSAALSDLMRGQRALERALADAGIDLADNGLRFELARDNGSGSANQQRDSNGRPAQTDVWRRFDTMTMPMTEETAAAVRPSWRPQRLDLVA